MPISQKARVKPTRRERQRFILYDIGQGTHKQMLESLKSLIGSVGMSEAGIMQISTKGTKGIIRTNSKSLELVKAMLTLTPEAVHTLVVSGTLSKLKR